MRNEVISAERNAQGQLEVETLWLLTDAEVAQFARTGLARPQADRSVLTQVHHILSPSRASERGQRVIRRPDGAMLHASGLYLPPDIEPDDPRLWTYAQAGPALATWVRTRGAGSVAAFGFVPTNIYDVRGAKLEYLDPQWQRETFVRDPNDEIAVVADWKGGLLDGQLTRGGAIEKRQRTTLNLQVGASADDALENAGTMYVGITAMCGDEDNKYGGMRWAAALENATINTAVVSVVPIGITSDEPLHNLDFEAADDGAAFSASANNISGRSFSGSPVFWDNTDLGADGSTFFSPPDCSSQVQAVIDRAGWNSGQHLVGALVQPTTSVLRDLVFWQYDQSSTVAAKLDIDYTAGGGAANPKGVLGMPLHGPFGGPI